MSQHDVLEAALEKRLQSLWSRKFWGTPRDETFLRRLDFYPKLSDAIRERNWCGGVGFKPFYPGASQGDPEPLEPWKLSDKFLANDQDFPRLVVREEDSYTLRDYLENARHRKRRIKASLKYLHRKPGDDVFSPPMVIYSKGFTKCAFCNYHRKLRFLDGLRSITGPRHDADLLRFLTAVISSRLFKYIVFHSASNLAVGRDQIHLYESLALPFPLPDHELARSNASEIVAEAAGILKHAEQFEQISDSHKNRLLERWQQKLDRLVEEYFSVSGDEKVLIEDTLTISQPSIHRANLNTDIPSLAFPPDELRKRYSDTLCNVLNRRARKQGIAINAQTMVSRSLNLILLTLLFVDSPRPYKEINAEDSFRRALENVSKAAERRNGTFSYLRGFSYVEPPDRLHMLKPATVRNWCRTAALNDADAIFEHLTRPTG